ncbi:MAG TPA: hypothetical protein PKA98_10990 [Acidimicrobiales bacterium]|nr:hypothetical protein [Acidimicrobiales bacterium]
MCSLSRYVVIGGFTGMAAATMTGSDLVGWLAAAVAVGLTALAMRRWPSLSGTCALPASPTETGAEHAAATTDREDVARTT